MAASKLRSNRRYGTVAVLVMVSLIVLLGSLTLAVDVGYICNLCNDMQVAADSSALAGASGLSVIPVTARERAEEYAALNAVAGSGIEPQELTMTIGHWYGLRNSFVPDDGTIPSTPNAIRVEAQRSGIALFFAGVLGQTSTTVTRGAAAMQGAGRCLGVWGLEGVVGSGDVITDSYIIDDGNYGGVNVRSNGDICSCQGITLGGNTAIHGDAIYGDGYDLRLNGTSYEIWGRVDDQPCNLNPPSFDMAGARTNNDNSTIPLTDDGSVAYRLGSGRLFLTGNDNLTLAPGKYYFSSVQIESLATLTITGPTEIYVSGNSMIGGGGIINDTGIPSNLKLYSTGGSIMFNGSSDFYGVVVAPETDMTFLGTSSYYGMIIGETLDFRGTTNIHVEESVVFDIFGVGSVAPMLIE